MGSRRMTRSSFSNGRSSSGEDSNGTSRPNSCSYISNVRPENRYRTEKVPFVTLLLQTRSQAHVIYLFPRHGHQRWNKLQIRSSMQVMQHAPHLTTGSFCMEKPCCNSSFYSIRPQRVFPGHRRNSTQICFSFAFKKVKPLQCVAN